MTWFVKLCVAVALFSVQAAAGTPPASPAMSLKEAVDYALSALSRSEVSPGGGAAPGGAGHHGAFISDAAD